MDHQGATRGPSKDTGGGVTVGPRHISQSVLLPRQPVITLHQTEGQVKEYLLKLCDGDPQKLVVMVGATSQPAASANPDPDEDPIPDTDADELQEPEELFLANAIVASTEYAEETQAETT